MAAAAQRLNPRVRLSLLRGIVSVRMGGKRCGRARLSVRAEAAAEVSLWENNVLFTLQRCAAWPHGKHGQVGCGRTVWKRHHSHAREESTVPFRCVISK